MSPNKHVNMLIVPDKIFELNPLDLASPDHKFDEIPRPSNRGKGYRNLFEFLMSEQWGIVSYSDMLAIMDKIESAISIEWHMCRGLNYSNEQLENDNKFAFSCTPYVPSSDDSRYWECEPFLIKWLIKEKRYDVPILSHEAPRGTSVWQTNVDQVQANDLRDALNDRYENKLKIMREEKPLPDVIPEMEPPKTHDYCQVCKLDYQDFFTHVDSSIHQKNSQLASDLFKQVDIWMAEDNEKAFGNKQKVQREHSQVKLVDKVHKETESEVERNDAMLEISVSNMTP